tara:strand:+ start:140 stop:433 length:294 start_codon:yes stop_codon:yes gene_type:complete
MNSLKKNIYIILFTFFGGLLGFFLHMLLEIFYINTLLISDYTVYNFGLSWGELVLVHVLFTLGLTGGGSIFGFFQGRYWWNIIYVEKRFSSLFRKRV